MYEIKTTTKFGKDLKLIKKRGYDLKFLKEVIEILSNGDYKMNNYIKLNEDRWNNVKNDYTEPLTHEELEEVRNNPISVALTVGKKVPKEWFEKANGKKILGLACGGGQQGPVFAIKGYDVTIMDFSKSQLQRDDMVAKREGLKINTVQGDMTKPFPFENETFDIIFNPVSNVYVEDLENIYKEASRVLKKGGLLMVGFMNMNLAIP